jgi:hypothetical protein
MFLVYLALSSAALPAPARLLTEWLPQPSNGQPLVLDTARPRFSFLPHAADAHPGAGTSMTAYRIVVSSAAGAPTVVWDSGVVAGSAAVGVRCGANLTALQPYSWQAEWWAADPASSQPSPVSAAAPFELGPVGAAAWNAVPWLGAPEQREFGIGYVAPPAAKRVRLFVLASGGHTVAQGVSDAAGVSMRTQFDAYVPYQGYDVGAQLLRHGGASGDGLVVTIGQGFGTPFADKLLSDPTSAMASANQELGVCRSTSDCAAHVSGLTPFAVGKVLLVVDGVPVPTAQLRLRGRRGRVAEANPFTGGVFDMTAAGAGAWGAVVPVNTSSANATPQGRPRALGVPAAVTAPRVAAEMGLRAVVSSVQPWRVLDPPTAPPSASQWLYTFSRNIVGTAIVGAGAYSGTGNLTLQYCEVLNGTRCLCLRRLCNNVDVFMVDGGADAASTAGPPLQASFTWHGFQYVIVTATAGVSFAAKETSLASVWTTNE